MKTDQGVDGFGSFFNEDLPVYQQRMLGAMRARLKELVSVDVWAMESMVRSEHLGKVLGAAQMLIEKMDEIEEAM